MYHNRGDSTFAGESSTYGDFSGLDDLLTERPEVVKGMEDIYKKWVDFGIDGFRIDTVKHVNIEFWQKFIPDILGRGQAGRERGLLRLRRGLRRQPGGDVGVHDRGRAAGHARLRLPAAGRRLRQGQAAPRRCADFFAKDDWYTDADSNAYQLPTFLGNHDMGRVGDVPRPPGRRGRAPQAGPVRRLADVHDPWQPGHLLRRRAGLRRHRW